MKTTDIPDMFRPEAGAVLQDRFVLEGPLAAGGQGQVWRARDQKNDTSVAVKLLRSGLGVTATAEDVERETKALLRLSHPNISPLISYSLTDAIPYLVTELVEGVPLQVLLGRRTRSRTPLSLPEVRDIFIPIGLAIHHAHQQGIVHRDLKPPNIMVDEAPSPPAVKVLDFGLARLLETAPDRATTFGRARGSPFYMSPEQIQGHPTQPASDIFALSTLLFELLTLHRAWARDDFGRPLLAYVSRLPVEPNKLIAVYQRITEGERPDPLALRPSLPPGLRELILRAWAMETDTRPSSAEEMVETVQREIEGETAPFRSDTIIFEDLKPRPVVHRLSTPTATELAVATSATPVIMNISDDDHTVTRTVGVEADLEEDPTDTTSNAWNEIPTTAPLPPETSSYVDDGPTEAAPVPSPKMPEPTVSSPSRPPPAQKTVPQKRANTSTMLMLIMFASWLMLTAALLTWWWLG